jgi:hypothetical protein
MHAIVRNVLMLSVSSLTGKKHIFVDRLIRSGFSNKDIASVMRQVRKDKHSRMVSSQQVNMDNLHEATEKVTVGFKKIFAFKKSEYDRALEEACSVVP